MLEKERNEAKTTLLSSLEEDKIVEGVVKNITDYGVFVDLGGLDGLLHITDLSYGRVRHPADLFKVGDTITVKVLSFDREKERISLGLKQLTPDPWSVVDEKFPLGTRVTGNVVSLTDYGSFVELEPGVEGLIHISEMSWTRKVRHPSQVLTVGDVVEATVLEVEPQRKRISLSLKQVEPNPWEVIGEKYPVGSVIEGKIKNITDFGIFIGIDEGIDGLVHISDISWTKRFKHPSELFKKGQVIQAKVLYIDKDNERFSLSIKDLADNPWQSIDERFPVNSVVSGPITNITDFGLFVEVEEGIEGLIHISEQSRDKQKMAALQVGDIDPGQGDPRLAHGTPHRLEHPETGDRRGAVPLPGLPPLPHGSHLQPRGYPPGDPGRKTGQGQHLRRHEITPVVDRLPDHDPGGPLLPGGVRDRSDLPGERQSLQSPGEGGGGGDQGPDHRLRPPPSSNWTATGTTTASRPSYSGSTPRAAPWGPPRRSSGRWKRSGPRKRSWPPWGPWPPPGATTSPAGPTSSWPTGAPPPAVSA